MSQQIVDIHQTLLNTMNVIVVRNNMGELIVVESKRSTKPSIPFIITPSVFQQWKARDSKVVIANLPYELLNDVLPLYLINTQSEPKVIIQNLNEIEFKED